jgi:cell division protein FtsN
MVRNVEGRTFYRAWLGSYDSREEARSLCKALKAVPVGGCAIFKGATMEARND